MVHPSSAQSAASPGKATPTPAGADSPIPADSDSRKDGRSRPGWLSIAITLGLAAISAAAIGIAGYAVGVRSAGAGDPVTPVASAPATVQRQIVWVTEQLQANPNDIVLLQHQGDLYYQTGDYGFAMAAMEKILAINSRNVKARLALAAGMFNLGKMTEAETEWRAVLELDPDNLEAHYDLGFMYLKSGPARPAEGERGVGRGPQDRTGLRCRQVDLRADETPRRCAGRWSVAPSAGTGEPRAFAGLKSLTMTWPAPR